MPDTAHSLHYANGIDPEGNYLVPPVETSVVSALARGRAMPPGTLDELKRKHQAQGVRQYGVDADETSLADAGWGVLFAVADAAMVPKYRDALSPLLERRKAQAGKRYYELVDENAYRPGETKDDFIRRFDLGPGPVNPDKLPYYLLIVGDPRMIPFRFQYQMDVQFAIGRLHFDGDGLGEEDRLELYARYARSTVEVEQRVEAGTFGLDRQAAFFGVRNTDDRATTLSESQLVVPLAAELQAKLQDWKISTYAGDQARRAHLEDLINGSGAPAFLFTASHGLGFKRGNSLQLPYQGALVCGDWDGPGNRVARDHYFAAENVSADARLLGMVAFNFACFGAGTPMLDDFSAQAEQDPIAPHDFVARLPQALLSHRNGSALAVIGHVDRAWGCSFDWGTRTGQRTAFNKSFRQMLRGARVGAALEDMNLRYAEIATMLAAELENIRFGKSEDQDALAYYWTANSDARNYVLLGDPAVQLPVAAPGGQARARPALLVPARQPPQAAPAPAAAAPGTAAGQRKAEDAFLIGPGADKEAREWMRELKAIDPELYEAWRTHIVTGFENNNRMFRDVLDAFMKPYHVTVSMHKAIFAVGLATIVAAIAVALYTRDAVLTGIFGGLSLAAFASYFVNRPAEALEENLEFVTWLGMIYNTYWVRLFQAEDRARLQADLKSAMEDSSALVKELIDKHREIRSKRTPPPGG
jgi:hypothetical protein